jgi:Zn-dependent membrane protease YugP
MTVIIFIIAIAAIIFGPGLWVRRVLERYSVPADRYSGTGAQLARHLLDKHGLTDVVVESTPDGDHYDPEAKAVRLTPDKFDGRSLTAITVAAHEVGHALQDHEGYAPLKIRSQLVRDASTRTRRADVCGGILHACNVDARTFRNAANRVQRQLCSCAADA